MASEQPNQEQSSEINDEFVKSCAENDLDKVRSLLEPGGEEKPEYSDETLYLSLISAAEKGHSGIVELLLKQKITQVINKKNAERLRALDLAAKNGHLQVVKALLGYENIKVRDPTSLKTTPLHLAAQNGHLPVVQALLEKRDVGLLYYESPDSDDDTTYAEFLIDSEDGKSRTPLHLAAQNGHTEVVEFLLRKRAKVALDDDHYTPLHLAAEEGHAETVRSLLSTFVTFPHGTGYDDYDGDNIKACVNAFCYNDMMTPLHLASKRGHYQVVEVLLGNNEINVNNTKCRGGSSALHLAAEEGHLEVIERLLQHPKVQNIKNSSKKTALDIAQERGHWSCVDALRTRFKK